MSYPLPLTRTEAYLAYKAGVIQQSELKPSLAVPRIGIDAWLAYWTQLANDYPKNPDGTPMILQEEEAYIAYLCGVIDTYPEKCLRRVGAYLRYIISARWGRPDHPLNREELYLSLIKTQFIPSGDPSSDITIDGTAKAPFVDVKLYGDTFQYSYDGSNLFNTTLENGTISSSTGDDGESATNRLRTVGFIELIGGATTVTFETSSSKTLQFVPRYYSEDGTYLGDGLLGWQTSPKLLNLPSGTRKIRLAFRFSDDTEISSDQITSVSITEKPAPNPDSPQPIKTVTGLQTVEVHGKNLLNLPASFTDTGANTTTTTSNGSTTISSSGTTRAYPHWCDREVNYPAGTYTFSISKALDYDIFIRLYQDGSTYPVTFTIRAGSTESTRTTTYKTVKIVGLIALPLGSTYSDTFNAQVEAGDTATSIVPYSSSEYEINLGKNLFDKSSGNILAGYVPGSTIVTQEINRLVWIKCEPNTAYALSTRAESWTREVYTTDIVPAVGVAATRLGQIGPGENSTTVQTGATAQYLAVRIWQQFLSGIPLEEELGYLQIELGSQATTYAPYFTPIELCKISYSSNIFQDYIYKDGDDWKLHKATTTKIFSGADSEGWVINNSGTENFYYRCPRAATGTYGTPDNSRYLYCNYESGAQVTTSNTTQGVFVLSGGDIRLRYGTEISLDDWKAKLAANSMVLTYALATPTDTVITNANLIAQLEALVAGGAEEGTTYIKVSATDPNLPAKLYVEAPKYD